MFRVDIYLIDNKTTQLRTGQGGSGTIDGGIALALREGNKNPVQFMCARVVDERGVVVAAVTKQ